MFCLFKTFKDLMSNVTRKRMSMHVLAMMFAFMFVILASSTDVFAMSVDGVKVETKYCTKNPCYTSSRRIVPKGLMIHSVGCPQPNPDVFANLWNSSSANVGVHYVAGTSKIIQMLPDNRRAWHCGSGVNGSGNSYLVSIEMTEPSTIKYTGGSSFIDLNPTASKAHVVAVYNNTVKWAAAMCEKYNFNPMTDIISHKEGHDRGVASNHGDPNHLLGRYGLSMDKFRADVKALMSNKGGTSGGGNAKPETPTTKELYRVRLSWDNVKSQVGAYSIFNNAKAMCDKHDGYSVFNSKGTSVYSNAASNNERYMIKVTTAALNIRGGAGTSNRVVGQIRDYGCYTIVETRGNWGRLLSGAGWICLDYTRRI